MENVVEKCNTCPRYLGNYPELKSALSYNEKRDIGFKLCSGCEDLEQGEVLPEL